MWFLIGISYLKKNYYFKKSDWDKEKGPILKFGKKDFKFQTEANHLFVM